MKHLLRLFTWTRCFVLSSFILPLLIFFSFYGLYSNKFYFFKIDNYIFPILALVHFLFLNSLWLADKDLNYENNSMRNLEYGMYAIFLVYSFKFSETIYILLSYLDYSEQIFPQTFLPVGLTILSLQLILLIVTLLTFQHRKERLGPYHFDKINEI